MSSKLVGKWEMTSQTHIGETKVYWTIVEIEGGGYFALSTIGNETVPFSKVKILDDNRFEFHITFNFGKAEGYEGESDMVMTGEYLASTDMIAGITTMNIGNSPFVGVRIK